jgi:GAF domain-containing protein
LITNIIALVMMIQLLYTIDRLYKKSNDANEELITKIEKEKEDQQVARTALAKTIAELNIARQQEELRTWASTGLADASKILRDEDANRLFDRLLSFLVKYLSANQGAIFMTKTSSGTSYLEMQACYAYEKKKFREKRIDLGDGLLGQCYYERSPIYLTEVPVDYIHITSGLGFATPRSVLLVPMIYNSQVYGIIEIAAFSKIEGHKIMFLSDVAESVAIACNNISVNEKTRMLLSETQMMAEQMKSQDEAMRQNMEEIALVQEEQNRTETQLRTVIENQNKEIRALRNKTAAEVQ